MTVKVKKKGELAPVAEPKLTYVQHVIKGDTYMVLAGSGLEHEDEFGGLYNAMTTGANTFIQPPFNPKQLAQFVITNNILSQCVDAMEVNIDGTGHEFLPLEEDTDIDETEKKRAESFFDEPYPQQSIVAIRRLIRRDLESLGYAFVEVLRNAAGELVGLRYIPAYMIRLVKLDDPVQVTKTVKRDGKDVEMTMWDRERRFAQRVAGKYLRFFKEYGATRQLHVKDGLWEGAQDSVERDDEGQPKKGPHKTPVKVETKDRATELKMFTVNPDIDTAYGLPRWINNLPSVIGSRKAEEHNLEFFDAGGIPPAIIFIQGGTLASDMSKQLKMYLSGQNKSRNRAVVVEAQANSGSLESVGSVQVKVERFGSEKANDAMFMAYDKAAEEHVRAAFRLPPMFLGKSEDYNFATAQTAYMVAEAQVFEPERCKFDEWVNRSLMRELKCEKIKFKSKPITLKDVETQLKAMEMVAEKVDHEALVNEVNKIAGVTLEPLSPEELAEKQAMATAKGTAMGTHEAEKQAHPDKMKMERDRKELEKEYAPKDPPPEKPKSQIVQVKPGHKVMEFPAGGKVRTHKHDAFALLDLVEGYLIAEGHVESDVTMDDAEKARIHKAVNELEGGDQEAFHKMVSLRMFGVEDCFEIVGGCDHD